MSSLTHPVAVLASLVNGVAAGIMLSTVLGIAPMFLALPYRQYVQTVQFLWHRYDPVMPFANGTTLVLDVLLAVLVPAPVRFVFAAAAAAQATVMGISVTRNVPVNRYVYGLDPQREPVDWPARDPRRRWRNWNALRTSFALAAFAANVIATVMS
ncbi:MAG: DUF1772 domain-containing protein [Micromonosporaceae bacterium]|nr:DUF1772 domain-containing protein [Micromonosporaceae bacterium]